MNAVVEWTDFVPQKDNQKSTINEVALSPDGTRLVAAVGNRVLLYDAETGNLIESLRGHKDTVLTVDFCADGTRFASGGADRVVVIWKSTGQGLLKYNHTSPIQRVRYNPCAMQLASCAEDDFGLWTPEQKQVQKDKVGSKVLSACWNFDGSILALGLQSGLISVRNNKAEELCKIERNAPIWCLQFAMGIVPQSVVAGSGSGAGSTSKAPGGSSTNATVDLEVLMVGCWDKTISAYRINTTNGNTAQKTIERNIRFYPTSISITGGLNSKNSFMLVTGSNKKCILFSRDVMKLTELSSKSSWSWSCATPHYGTHSNRLAIGFDNGDIDVLNLKFDNVYAITPDRYAYRENLTEIVVQHLITDRKVRIKCRDLVQKLSVYKNKLAVQVSDKLFVYESNPEDLQDIHFRLKKERISQNIICETMSVVSNHVIFTNKNMVMLYTFDGIRVRSWTFEDTIKCVKIDTGVENHECCLVGLQNGAVHKIFIDNPFALELAHREKSNVLSMPTDKNNAGDKAAASTPPVLSCVDLNLHRTLLATVDTDKQLVVSDLQTQETLFKYSGATYVCFNQEVDDMLCFTTESSMFVVSGLQASAATTSSVDNANASAMGTGFGGGRGKSNKDSNAGNNKDINMPIVRSYRGDDIVPQEQHIGGPSLALLFSGQRLFCLYRGAMTNLDIPQGINITKAVELNDYDTAYHLACLGATAADWRYLGMRALRANYLAIAKNCFARLQDTKYLSVIDVIENKKAGGLSGSIDESSRWGGSTGVNSGFTGPKSPDMKRLARSVVGGEKGAAGTATHPPLEPQWVAEILAYEGHAMEAAKIYARCSKIGESIRLLTELRRYNDAKLFAQNVQKDNAGSNPPIDTNELTLQQAKWLQETNDWKAAVELYLTLGQFMTAVKVIVEYHMTGGSAATTKPSTDGKEAPATANAKDEKAWRQFLLEVMRRIPKEQSEVLYYIGDVFTSLNEDDMARECYTKLNDISKLMFLFARKQMWSEAAKLAEEHPGEFDCTVFLPYAEWLIMQDQFMDAMNAYKKANRRDLARKVLQELTYNAVMESRFKDAGYYYWMLSREYEATAVDLMNGSGSAPSSNSTTKDNKKTSGSGYAEAKRQVGGNNNASDDISSAGAASANAQADQEKLTAAQCQQMQLECEHKADLYYAYSTIYSYICDPFTVHQPDTLFQVCRFIINSIGGGGASVSGGSTSSASVGDTAVVPYGISKAFTYYTLAKQAMKLGCYKLARYSYERLNKLQVTIRKQQDDMELDMLIIQAKPVHDNPEQLPVCYRCGATNALLNPFTNKYAKGDVCTACGHPFVRSFVNFDVLPLVEFVPDPSISDEEAIELIRSPSDGTGTLSNQASMRLNKSMIEDGNSDSKTTSKRSAGGGGWKESKEGSANVLSLGGDGDGSDEVDEDYNSEGLMTMGSNSDYNNSSRFGGGGGGNAFGGGSGLDLFTKCLNRTLERQQNASYVPVLVDANTLLSMKRNEVYICKPTYPHKRATFYKNMLPDIAIAISPPCHRFFHLEDFEFSYLSEKCCPYSRLKNIGEYGSL